MENPLGFEWSKANVTEISPTVGYVETVIGNNNLIVHQLLEQQATRFPVLVTLFRRANNLMIASFRSRNGEALKMAEKFQGGGHANASGATLPKSVRTVPDALAYLRHVLNPNREVSLNRLEDLFNSNRVAAEIGKLILCVAGCAGFSYAAMRMAEREPTIAAGRRADGREPYQLRPLRFQNGVAPYATGSTLIEWGNTRVICAVTVEDVVPRWMKEARDGGSAGGWVTAEYSMLPYSTLERKPRDITKGRIDGRTQEIQRLIGRSMRTAVDLDKIGPRTIWVDCDVLQADGGTRTAAITGGCVALTLAVKKLMADGKLTENPLLHSIAAVSVGIVDGQALLDLCYTEDVAASVDFNLVMNSAGEFIELQGTGEESTFSESQLAALLAVGKDGIRELLKAQEQALA